MGYRTHLTLSIPGEDKLLILKGSAKVGNAEVEQIITQKFPTNIMLLNNECIGKVYFYELPEELLIQEIYKEDDSPIWFNEYTEDGEIHVGAFIKLLKTIEKIQKKGLSEEQIEDNWYLVKEEKLIENLEFWLSAGIISKDTTIKFEVY